MATLKDNIIEILLKSNRLTKEQLDRALNLQKEKGVPLRKILLDEGITSEDDLLSLLSEQLYMPTLHLSKYRFDPDVVNLIPERMSRQYNLIPLSRIGNTLTVAISDPLNIFALDDLKVFTGCSIDTVLSPEEEISKAIATAYHASPKDMQQILEEDQVRASPQEKEGIGLLKEEEIELTAAIQE